MKDTIFEFNQEKNKQLKKERGIGFDEIIALIEDDKAIDLIDHPDQQRYPDQMIYVINVEGYAYLVPFICRDNVRFLKTIYASRKATKQYLKEKRK
ncbi:MAG: toxin [Alphaproteobacteria bacterium]|nr:toxin [Alphaproteobacteria bacterium]